MDMGAFDDKKQVWEYSEIRVSGVDWRFARLAVSDPDGRLAPGFAKAGHLDPELYGDGILISSDPKPPAERHWGVEPDFEADRIYDTTHPRVNSYWSVLTEENLAWAEWHSGTSGSSIMITRDCGCGKVGDRDTFTVIGRFPIDRESGDRYEGTYFDALQMAIKDAVGRSGKRK